MGARWGMATEALMRYTVVITSTSNPTPRISRFYGINVARCVAIPAPCETTYLFEDEKLIETRVAVSVHSIEEAF
jgi:hypothetical protein